MDRNIFNVSPVDEALDETRQRSRGILEAITPKFSPSSLRDVARVHQVPQNIIEQIVDEAGISDTSEQLRFADEFAGRIGQELRSGRDMPDAVRSVLGKDAPVDDFLNRAIQRVQKQEADPEIEAPDQASTSEPGLSGDAGRMVVGGVAKGVGSVVQGLGQAFDTDTGQQFSVSTGPDGMPIVEMTPTNRESGIVTGTRDLAQKISGWGKSIQGGVSAETKTAMAESMPDGDLFDPSTWTLGENPSVRGYAMLATDVLGSLAPVVLAGAATGGTGAAVVGGAQSAGAGAEQARQILDPMSVEDLEAESAYFREAVAAGATPEEAKERTIQAAERMSAMYSAPVGALGGAITGQIVKGGMKSLASKGIAARTAGTGTVSAVEEGTQEAAEGVAARAGVEQGSGVDVDLTEGTFGDAVLGALAGGPVGAVSGAVNREAGPEDDAGPEAEPEEAPLFTPDPVSDLDLGPYRVDPDDAGTSPDLERPAAGPLSRAAEALGPTPSDPKPFMARTAKGARVKVNIPGGAPIEAVFQDETDEGVTLKVDNNPFMIPREELESGEVQLERVDELASARPAEFPDTTPLVPGVGEGFAPGDRPANSNGKSSAAPRLMKRPFTNQLATATDGIDPNSRIGKELAARDINPATVPGLFRQGGATSLDNMVADEWGELRYEIGVSPDGAYLDEQGIIDAIEREHLGTPVQNNEQKALQEQADSRALMDEARERGWDVDDAGTVEVEVEPTDFIIPTRESDISTDEERLTLAQSAVQFVEQESGAALTPAERDAIITNLTTNGGSVEDAVWSFLEKEVETDDGGTESQESADTAEPVLQQETPGTDRGEGDGQSARGAGQPDIDQTPEGQGTAGSATAGVRADPTAEGGPEVTNARDPEEQASQAGDVEQTPAGAQALIPGVEPITDKAKAETQAAKPKRGGYAPLPEGGLFDDAARNQPDMFSDATPQPEAQGLKSEQQSQPVIENIRQRAAILKGVPKGQAPEIKGVSLKWEERSGGYVFSRKHVDKVRAALDGSPAPETKEPAATPSKDMSPKDFWSQAADETKRLLLSEAGERGALANSDWADLDTGTKRVISKVYRANTKTAAKTDAEEKKRKDLRPTQNQMPPSWKPIGKNKAGHEVFEDDRGVRSYVEKGIRITESVGVIPGGGIEINTANRSSRFKPVDASSEAIEAAAAQTDPNPTPAQAEAENYKTGKAQWNGLTLSIENAKGGTRSGTDADGNTWSVTMPAHYGRILRTEGADGDHVDFYMGDNPDSRTVTIINQKDPKTGKFDEHKVVLGASNKNEALRIYRAGFSDGSGQDRIMGVSTTDVDSFKGWLNDQDTTKPAESDNAPAEDLDAMFDELADEIAPETKQEPAAEQPKAPRTAPEAAKSAVKNTAEGVDAALDGLIELFGGKDQINSGLTFSKETYEKAKPMFIDAARHFGAAGQDIRDVMRAVIQALVEKGLDPAGIRNMKPYVVQFTKDVQSGDIALNAKEPRNDRRDNASALEADAAKQEAARKEEAKEKRARVTGEPAPRADGQPTPETMKTIVAAVNAQIKESGLEGKVTARAWRKIENGPMKLDGFYMNSRIHVSASSRDSTIDVARHEVVHALRDPELWNAKYGVFTQAEWQGLVKAARSDTDKMREMRRLYGDQPESVIVEEVIAEKFRDWMQGRDVETGLARALRKIRDALNALANALTGAGFQSAGRTFERMANGDLAQRAQQRDAQGRFVADDAPIETQPAKAARQKRQRPVNFIEAPSVKAKSIKAGGSQLLSDALTQIMSGIQGGYNILALVPGRPLLTELAGKMPSIKKYLAFKEKMDALRQEIHANTDKVAQKWRKLSATNKKANKALMDLMHETTIEGLDPSMPFVPIAEPRDPELIAKYGESSKTGKAAKERVEKDRIRKSAYDRLRAKFERLPEPFQKMYSEVRDEYTKAADAFEAAIKENAEKAVTIAQRRAERNHKTRLDEIRDEGLTGKARDDAVSEAKAELINARKMSEWSKRARLYKLRESFESNRLSGPYFPLARFGKFFVAVRDGKGAVISFSMFETARAQRKFAAEMEKEGYTDVRKGIVKSDAVREAIDPGFVADIEALLEEAGAGDPLLDAIWQHWLTSLPDLSLRKSRIHRQATPGYSEDALRAFGNHMFHGAHQLARLKYGFDMSEALEVAQEEVERSEDPVRTGLVLEEIKRRNEFVMNPAGAWWAQGVTSAAFVMYLGMTPGAALVNLTQTTVVGIPILSAWYGKNGVRKASAELTRAMADFTRGKGQADASRNLTADERKAMSDAYDMGTIDKSESHDLAGIGETGVEYSPAMAKAMNVISYMFHHAERMNREVTFLAAYRMAKTKGLNHDDAVHKAADLTWKTHFDYQANSRPRLQQNDMIRVMTVFKNFQLNMLWRLFRDTHQALHGADSEVRSEARHQLIGITSQMLLHSGIKGVWGYSILTMLAGMFFPGGSDDVENEMEKALLAYLPSDMVGMMLNGVPGHLLGIDLRSRIGMPDLWFRGSDRDLEGDDEFFYWTQQVLGAGFGMVYNTYRGVQNILDGEGWRGIERIVPKFVRDYMKTGRYFWEGAETYKGDPIVEQFTVGELLAQAMGFTPAELSRRYEINNRKMNYQKRVLEKRRDILREAGNAVMKSKPIPKDVLEGIKRFNRTHRDYPITPKTLRMSVDSRLRSSDRNDFGVQINPRLQREIDEYIAPADF